MNLSHDYLMQLFEIDTKIAHMNALLSAPIYKHIGISFSTTTSPGQPDRFHRLEDENFAFSLSYELVKIFNLNIDLLEMQKEKLLNERQNYQLENDILELKKNINQL